MTPDHKYMPRAIDNYNSQDDLEFSQFNIQPPFNSSMIGWIPIMMIDGTPVNGIPSNLSPLSQNSTLFMQPNNQFTPNNLNQINNPNNQLNSNSNNQNINTNVPSNNISTGNNKNLNSMQNIVPNNSNLQYPNELDEVLYSYNTPNSSTDNTTPSINNNSSYTTTPNSIINSNMNNSSMNSTNNANDLIRVPTPSDVLRILDLNLDEDIDLDRNHSHTDINKIYNHIKDECPGIINVLCEYKIPEPIYKLLIKKIIKLSLTHCKRE